MSPPAIPSAFAVASLPLPSVTARTPTSPELTTVDESMDARMTAPPVTRASTSTPWIVPSPPMPAVSAWARTRFCPCASTTSAPEAATPAEKSASVAPLMVAFGFM